MEPWPQGGLARLWLPARSLEEGLVLRSTELRSAPIWDQRIGF
jgi:hypothetical protein